MILSALLVASAAALVQEPAKTPDSPTQGILKFTLPDRAVQGKSGPNFSVPPVKRVPPQLRMAPGKVAAVTDTPRAGTGVCSVPLINALRGGSDPGMPVITPPAHGFTIREVAPPAPPCGQSRP